MGFLEIVGVIALVVLGIGAVGLGAICLLAKMMGSP